MMSGAPRVRSMNVADSEDRPVLGPTGNKAMRSVNARKPTSKPLRKGEKSPEEVTPDNRTVPSSMAAASSSPMHSITVPSILRRQEQLLHSNLSLNASCSSDASTDSFHSRASTGRLNRTRSMGSRKMMQYSLRPKVVASDGVLDCLPDDSHPQKRCAWVTPNTDPSYAAFHDEEWGVPVHDDKKLFELLVLSGGLAELTWPAILSKRHIFREVFADFDPFFVSKLNEKRILAPGSTASSLLSELKLRAIFENARQITKVIDEFGSFDNYIWSFVNYKPIVSKFRYPRHVPVKTPKADVISKDLVRRGFRSVGPTVIYSFMQVAGITNDHLIGCFRFHECITAAEGKKANSINDNSEDKETNNVMMESDISRAINEMSFCSE